MMTQNLYRRQLKVIPMGVRGVFFTSRLCLTAAIVTTADTSSKIETRRHLPPQKGDFQESARFLVRGRCRKLKVMQVGSIVFRQRGTGGLRTESIPVMFR